jgi:hypothetical protein
MKPLSVYVETSVWNFVFAEGAPERSSAAVELIDNREAYELFVSRTVIDEIEACPGQLGKDLLNLVIIRAPGFLIDDPGVYKVADFYVERGIIPRRYYNDAVHIASATFHDIDYLASYNFKHIVRVKTKAEVAAANVILGYRGPVLVNPEELVFDEE